MVVPQSLRLLLTVALTGGTVFHLGRALRPGRSPEERVAEMLHAVMGAAMAGMLWPFGRAVPEPAGLVVFAGAAGWFAAQASRAGGQRFVSGYSSLSAAAMVWMSSRQTPGPATAMPMDMDMPTSHAPAVTAAAIGGSLVLVGLWWLLRGLRLGTLHRHDLRTPSPAGDRSAADEPAAGSGHSRPADTGPADTGPADVGPADSAPAEIGIAGIGSAGFGSAQTAGTTSGGIGAAEISGEGPSGLGRRAVCHASVCHGIMGVSMGLVLLTMV